MAFKMKGMHHGHGTGSALKLFGLFGGGKEEEKPPPPPVIEVAPKKDKDKEDDSKDLNAESSAEDNKIEDVSTTASKEYEEQNLMFGQSNPNAQEAEDTIGEGTRSVINRSKRFNA